MTQPRHPLRINVGFIVSQSIGYSRDFTFEFPQLQLQDLYLDAFHGSARISRTPQGLLVQAHFRAQVKQECVRCLDEFSQPIAANFSELYAFSHRSVSDSGLILPDDGNIDLAPLVRDYLLIEIPYSPICKPDCRGLCVICGENLNYATCEHQALGENRE